MVFTEKEAKLVEDVIKSVVKKDSKQLSKAQITEIEELGKAHQEGFLSYADFEKRVIDIISAATAHSSLDEIKSFILSSISNAVTLALLKDIFNRLE